MRRRAVLFAALAAPGIARAQERPLRIVWTTIEGAVWAAFLVAYIGFARLKQCLVLDFSGRPFDEVELNRVRRLAEQIGAAL